MSYILCPSENDNNEQDAVYTIDIDDTNILVIFEEKDDATRYSEFLSEQSKNFSVVEIEKDLAVEMCEMNGYNYTIIDPDKLILPLEHD